MTKFLLYGVINAIFAAITYALYREGYATQAVENDIMYIMPALGAVFIFGQVMVFVSKETAYFCSESMIVLGFLGTLLGIWTAFSGINTSMVGDVNQVGSVLATLMQGMGAALWTTLTGAYLALWLNAALRTQGG